LPIRAVTRLRQIDRETDGFDGDRARGVRPFESHAIGDLLRLIRNQLLGG
jgi:hypothetical protein